MVALEGNTLAIIAIALGAFALGMGIANIIHKAYGFNMTDDLIKEERIVQACITFHIEAAECEAVYGGTPGDGIITEDDARGLKLK